MASRLQCETRNIRSARRRTHASTILSRSFPRASPNARLSPRISGKHPADAQLHSPGYGPGMQGYATAAAAATTSTLMHGATRMHHSGAEAAAAAAITAATPSVTATAATTAAAAAAYTSCHIITMAALTGCDFLVRYRPMHVHLVTWG